MEAAAAPTVKRSAASRLPSELWLHILCYLSHKDFVSLSAVCSLFRDLTGVDSLWKIQCHTCFMLNECPEDSTWKQLFLQYYENFGNCLNCYRDIRTSWNKIMGYLAKYDKVITGSLKPPATEEELCEAESRMQCRFPDDLRCSLKIYNGQKQGAGPGLLGCIAISTHFRSEKILDCKIMADNFADSEPLEGCTPITYCCMTQRCQLISLKDESGIPRGQVFFPCADEVSEKELDLFICGNTYSEWLADLADTMENEIFMRIRGCHFRFLYEPSCVAETRDLFTVRVASCFMPDLSTVHPPSFFYVYRITIKMSDDASISEVCQLQARHWVITDMDGNEEIVDGPGVVGENPLFAPGTEYAWESATKFPTTYGNMKGHFVMKSLESGKEFEVECPVFHMKCLPYSTSSQRRERIEELKKNQ